MFERDLFRKPVSTFRDHALVQRRACAAQNWLRSVSPLQLLDLPGELAPLHGEIKERVANVPICRFLRHPVAFKGVGSAVFFGHRARTLKVCIAQLRESRFALDQTRTTGRLSFRGRASARKSESTTTQVVACGRLLDFARPDFAKPSADQPSPDQPSLAARARTGARGGNRTPTPCGTRF